MDPLSIIASTIAIVGVVASSSKAIQSIKGLPSEFKEVNQNLPLVQDTLVLARDRLKDGDGVALDESSKNAIEPVLSGCETKARMLQEIFDKIEKGAKDSGGSGLDLYRTALLRLGKAHRVETLLRDIIKSLDLLATNQFFRASIKRGKLVDAEDELSGLQSSVPDSEFESAGNVQNIAEGATGQQTNIYGQGHNISSGSGKQFNAHIMNFSAE
ncbi:WD domain-containing protein [Plectosphaerella plurivora]|uniref:WD domain-containing protein n=1 Tax=Plectosphaerella plurivora TaxID=936078 RepID=A0A9P9A3T4_9PEZI|nr:WD domain-containing protein [Plectosphaerella plurivora]